MTAITVQTVPAADFLAFRGSYLRACRKMYAEFSMGVTSGRGSARVAEMQEQNPEWAAALEPEMKAYVEAAGL